VRKPVAYGTYIKGRFYCLFCKSWFENLLDSCYIEFMKRSLQLRSLRLLGRSRLSY